MKSLHLSVCSCVSIYICLVDVWLFLPLVGIALSEEAHFLAGAVTPGYSGDPKKRGINPNLYVWQVRSDGRFLA